MGIKLEQPAHPISFSKAKAVLRNSFRTEWRRLDIETEKDSTHQLGKSARHNCLTENWTLSTPLSYPQTENFTLRWIPMRHRSVTPQPHPALLPHLRHFQSPDMAQFNGCPQEAMGVGGDTAADCRLCLTYGVENLAWPGT